jgi:mono/diheme cytochrome c family protein
MLRADLSLLALLALAGCELGVPAGDNQFYELNMTNMADQPKLKPQREDIFGTRGVGLLARPEGAVAVGEVPYPFTQEQAELAGSSLSNPLPASPETLAMGEGVYKNFCEVCHGVAGEGDGPMIKKFPAPPSFNRQRARDYTDGRIFHVPMRGQNVMPSYAKQIEPEEIWAAVHYIRKLQADNPVAPPTEDDLELLAREAASAATDQDVDASEQEPALTGQADETAKATEAP